MFRNSHFFERAGSGEEPGTNFGSLCGHEAGRKRATDKFGGEIEKGMHDASGHQAGRKRAARKLGKS